MPPTPRLEVFLNQDVYEQLCSYMDLDPLPAIRFQLTGEDGKVYGRCANDGKSITIYYGVDIQLVDRLRFVASQIVQTVLHELRHVHQIRTWGERVNDGHMPYAYRPTEVDANIFMREQADNWRGLIRLKRTQHNSGFSKLSQHATKRVG